MPKLLPSDDVWINGHGHIGFTCPHSDPVAGEDVVCFHWNEFETPANANARWSVDYNCANCGRTVSAVLPRRAHAIG